MFQVIKMCLFVFLFCYVTLWLCYVLLCYVVLGYVISYNSALKLYLAYLAAEGLDENGFQIEEKI